MQSSPATAELSDQEATGVDFIVAMARLRRENRVLSLDEESDRDYSAEVEKNLVPQEETAAPCEKVPSHNAVPIVDEESDRVYSTPVEKDPASHEVTAELPCDEVPSQNAVPTMNNEQGSKKKRKRHKRKRDQFVKLLLKHVNYEALVADLVEQEKRAYGYESSSSLSSTADNTATLPLERYIRVLERENKIDDEENDQVSSDNEPAGMDVEMAKAILKPFLSEYSGQLLASGSPAAGSSKSEVSNTVPKNEENEQSDVGYDNIASSNHSEADGYANEATAADEINETEALQQSYEVAKATPCFTNASAAQEMAEPTSILICDKKSDIEIDTDITLSNTSPAGLEKPVKCCDTSGNATVEQVAHIEEDDSSTPAQKKDGSTVVETASSTRGRGRKRQARRAAATDRVLSKRMKTRLNVQALTPTVEVIPMDRFDAPYDEVVSDCSSDGLSIVEVSSNNSSRKRSTRGGTDADVPMESETVAIDGSLSPTVPSATASSSRTTKASTHTSTIASKLPKASNPDTQYVISEVDAPEEHDASTPRLLEVVNVRNNRVLLTATPTPRQTRSSGPMDTPPQKDTPKRGRGRPTKASKEQQVQVQVPNEAPVPEESGTVKCGNCGEDVPSSAWENHLFKHNGIAFRVGIDEAFDLKDIRALSTALTRFMKHYRRAEVACERCGTIKKSCMGMASHFTSCGLAAHELEDSKVTCEHCGRKMKAVSLGVHHQQHCKVLKQQQQQQQQKNQKEANSASDDAAPKETTASGRKKRKSVATAEQKIKKLAKEVTADVVPDAELVLMVSGPDVANAVKRCWLSHLHQSNEFSCREIVCAFFGQRAEFIRTQYGLTNGSTEPKPIYQCAKCPQMAVERTVLYEHLRKAHPAFVKSQQYSEATGGGGSDNDSDVYVVGVSSSDDSFSSALDGEDEGMATMKKGKGKKVTFSSKPRKSGETVGKSAGGKKANATKAATGLQQEGLDERKEDETEVYKEMVFLESVVLKQEKNNFHHKTVKWMLQFRREHYAARVLFADLRPEKQFPYQLLPKEHAVNYMPKVTHSIRYLQCNSNLYDPPYKAESFANRWSQLATFEGEAHGSESIFYCGGPVVSLDWLPLADGFGAEDDDQYLAVACRQTYDEHYNCEELATPQPRKCLIQIWNVGPIQNAALTMKFPTRCPQLAFAIACDYGPIWQIAFCPSGCYNDPDHGDGFERLGLLAVAGSDGDVHLYALSRNMASEQKQSNASTAPRIVTLQPVTLLSLSFTTSATHPGNSPASDFTKRSVVRLAWSRDKGHCVLAAGYSNGVVAVWNLAATSSLLCGTKNGIRTLLPVHKLLHSSSSCIMALDLHYGSGSRYLVVCNADRRMKVYDLRCGQYQPLETCSMVTRSRVTSMRWLLHFPVLVYCYDDALCIDRCAYSVHQPRDIGLRNYSIYTIGSETTDVGVNDWFCTNAIATRGGDLVSHRPIPFVHGMNYKKLAQILTTTIPLKINQTADSEDVSAYNKFSVAYGLVFSDTDKVPTAMDSAALKLKSWRRGKLNHYPAERLNQIRWNPNSGSYTYYAIGYQAGFVRIRLFRM
uniref:C2H2-type domain-containing protein n=1 Tax=Anopheles farauti TaxID=69004 RepID=A0A182Q479_9DIPT